MDFYPWPSRYSSEAVMFINEASVVTISKIILYIIFVPTLSEKHKVMLRPIPRCENPILLYDPIFEVLRYYWAVMTLLPIPR